MRSFLAAAAVTMALAASGCDSGDSRTTGTVDDLPPGTLCLVPEDPEQPDLRACFSLAERDASKVHIGDCITLVVPVERNQPLRSIRRLDRRCRPPEPPPPGAATETPTSSA